jgi:hypothetical protein
MSEHGAEEVTTGWRKLQNKKLHHFCLIPNSVKMIK